MNNIKNELKSNRNERLMPDGEYTFMSYQEHINRYIFASKFVKNKIVLDIACGSGYGSNYLVTYAKRVIGGDIFKDALIKGKANSEKELEFICLDATNIPFSDNSFDIIVSFETIEHIKNYKKFLCECRRILKNGGIFICSTPNKEIVSPGINGTSSPFHVKEFYSDEFYKLLGEYFVDISKYGQNYIRNIDKIRFKLINIGANIISIMPKESGTKIKNIITRFVFKEYRREKFMYKNFNRLSNKKFEVLPIIDIDENPEILISVGKR